MKTSLFDSFHADWWYKMPPTHLVYFLPGPGGVCSRGSWPLTAIKHTENMKSGFLAENTPKMLTLRFRFVHFWASPLAQMVRDPPADARDLGSIPESGRSPGEGNGKSRQHSCLEKLQYPYLGNPTDRRAWHAAIHGVTDRHAWVTITFTYSFVGNRWLLLCNT